MSYNEPCRDPRRCAIGEQAEDNNVCRCEQLGAHVSGERSMKSIRKEVTGNNYVLIVWACLFVVSNVFVYIGTVWRNNSLLEDYREINELVLLNNQRKTCFKLYCKSRDRELLDEYREDCEIFNDNLLAQKEKMEYDANCKMTYRLVCQVATHSQMIANQYINPTEIDTTGIINYLDEVDLELEKCMNQLINHYLEYLNSTFGNENERFRTFLLTFNMGFVVVCVYVLWRTSWFSDKIMKSIENLSTAATEITNQNFETPDIEENTFEELRKVAETFDQMKHSIREMILELKEKHKMKEYLAEAKIRELQMQMNPHFLFNTLSLVVRNIQMDQKDTSIQLIQSISRILRNSIEIKELAISLDDEIDLLQAYLYIQKLHLKGRVTFYLDVRKSFLDKDFKIPPFTIQPLVENSVQHGLKDKVRDGKVEILITEKTDYMEVIVADNGIGFPASGERTADSTGADIGIPKTSIGLKNVQERLKLYYKNDDVMKIERVDDMTKITLKLYKTEK